MDNINDMMDDDGYAGYEADPLDDNYQVKCGQILVSAIQKFSLRCAGCELEYDGLKDFINHYIEMHSFIGFEVDTKNNGRKSVFESNDDSNASNIITMGPPACGSLDASNNSLNSFSKKHYNNYDNEDEHYEEFGKESSKSDKPLIKLKPLHSLQKRKSDITDDEARPPRKRVYEQSECRFECKYCDKSYPYSSSLNKHRKTFHNDIKKYQCSFCDNRFTDEIYLIRHQRARHKNELKPYADDPILRLEDFDDNPKNGKESDNETLIKNEPFDDEEMIRETNPNSYKKSNDDEGIKLKLNYASIKDKSFNSTTLLNEGNSSAGKSEKSNNHSRPPKVIYKCTMCPEEDNFTFRSKKKWQAHENHVHLQLEKFRCQICNIGDPSKKQFQDHEQEKHQDRRPYKCPICFFAFKERKHLMRHERVHTGEKPFKCPYKAGNKCSLTHCRKSKRDIPNLKLFKFPAYDSPLFSLWVQTCKFSEEFVADSPLLFLCEKHFSSDLIGVRKLKNGAIPNLFLDNTANIINTPNNNSENEDMNNFRSPLRKRKRSEYDFTSESPTSFCKHCKKTIKNSTFYQKKIINLSKKCKKNKIQIKSLKDEVNNPNP